METIVWMFVWLFVINFLLQFIYQVLALNMELMNVASLLGIGLTYVWRIFHDFIGAVNDILKPKHIVVPTIMVFV